MLIDFHTHCFPDALAHRALETLAYNCGGVEPICDGTLSGLRESMRRDGVDVSVVLNIATNARQQHKVNDFARETCAPDIVGFGSVFPDAEDALDEIDRIADMGLQGIKLHPEFQNFFVDDPKMKPLYRKISRRGLILTFHSGKDDGYPSPVHCTPERLARALQWLDTPVVAAHWGARGMEDEVLEHLCGRDVYLDTAYSYGAAVKPMLIKILEKHGTDKVLFATDSPWQSARNQLRQVDTLGLTPQEREKLLFRNALRLLGRPEP